jgi:hypothetical protein
MVIHKTPILNLKVFYNWFYYNEYWGNFWDIMLSAENFPLQKKQYLVSASSRPWLLHNLVTISNEGCGSQLATAVAKATDVVVRDENLLIHLFWDLTFSGGWWQ